jgi:hypothetical protein
MWTRRNPETDIKTRGVSTSWDESVSELRMLRRRCPAYSGRDLVPGSFWELREPVVMMPKGEIRVTELASMRVPMHGTGAELLVVVRKRL